jgi:DNA-binding XRE family transcriptional regulator
MKPVALLYPDALNTLGDHMRKNRLDLGLRQKDAAKQLGVDLMTVNYWETNRNQPNLAMVPRITNFLGYNRCDTAADARAGMMSCCQCRLLKRLGALDHIVESRFVRVARLAGMNDSYLAILRRLDQFAIRTGVWIHDIGLPVLVIGKHLIVDLNALVACGASRRFDVGIAGRRCWFRLGKPVVWCRLSGRGSDFAFSFRPIR